MKVNQLKSVLYEWIKSYWSEATVIWGSVSKVEPHSPFIVLNLETVNRSFHPVTLIRDGIAYYGYPSEVTLQIDLFTRGKENEVEGGTYYENTALSDMLDFFNYLNSVATIEWSSKYNISIEPVNGVQDLTQVVNDSQWQYRSMLEINVAFMQWTADYYGVLNEDSIIFDKDGMPIGVDTSKWKQTDSGGGSEKLAVTKTGYFDDVTLEIIQKQEE